ncbi:uroporphyrinogen-III synthase [Natronorarus salvus]|uniref:uroporphyrinogen-III synthase n=1 Tax=Natronorarus salvus TaxID=3117733 RepID=UPI002F26D322
MSQEVRVALFRPDDERLAEGIDLLESLGAIPVPDPMLEVRPTGSSPREDAAYTIFTSQTGVELASDAEWDAGETSVCAIGERTSRTLREAGYRVDLVPDVFSSTGLVNALCDRVPGRTVEVARSDHGSPVLTDGVNECGGYVHETVLYELVVPEGAGVSAERAATGELEAALFTSSLTVEHFLESAEERGVREDALAGLERAVIGVIGEPTRETAEGLGIAVDVVPERATFEALACEAVERAAPTYYG